MQAREVMQEKKKVELPPQVRYHMWLMRAWKTLGVRFVKSRGDAPSSLGLPNRPSARTMRRFPERYPV